MHVISARGERSITELARRVFSITGGHGSAAESAAVAALTRANPHLTVGQPVETGTPVFVPALEHEGAREPAPETLEDLKGVAAQVREAMSQIAKELETNHASQREQDEALLATLKEHSRELSATGGEEAVARVKELQKVAKLRLDASERDASEQRAALADVRRDLDRFLKTF